VDDSTKPFHLRLTATNLLASDDSDALLSTLTLLDFEGIQEFGLMCGISDISESILKSTDELPNLTQQLKLILVKRFSFCHFILIGFHSLFCTLNQ